jgi:D-alanine transaminase
VEAIQFRDSWLTEASSSNVWIVKNGKLMVPPKDNLILEGIRYRLIGELCATGDIVLEARRIAREEVFSADEVPLSSAIKEVLAEISIDGKTIGKSLARSHHINTYIKSIIKPSQPERRQSSLSIAGVK